MHFHLQCAKYAWLDCTDPGFVTTKFATQVFAITFLHCYKRKSLFTCLFFFHAMWHRVVFWKYYKAKFALHAYVLSGELPNYGYLSHLLVKRVVSMSSATKRFQNVLSVLEVSFYNEMILVFF